MRRYAPAGDASCMPFTWLFLSAAAALALALALVIVALCGILVRRRASKPFEYMAYCVYFARALLGKAAQPRPPWRASEAEVVAAMLGIYDASRKLPPDNEEAVLRRVKSHLNAQRDA